MGMDCFMNFPFIQKPGIEEINILVLLKFLQNIFYFSRFLNSAIKNTIIYDIREGVDSIAPFSAVIRVPFDLSKLPVNIPGIEIVNKYPLFAAIGYQVFIKMCDAAITLHSSAFAGRNNTNDRPDMMPPPVMHPSTPFIYL
jgi:hypothetical protein